MPSIVELKPNKYDGGCQKCGEDQLAGKAMLCKVYYSYGEKNRQGVHGKLSRLPEYIPIVLCNGCIRKTKQNLILPVRNPSLYDGMTINEILFERKTTLEQIEKFHRQRPTVRKSERIHEILDEIKALELLAKEAGR